MKKIIIIFAMLLAISAFPIKTMALDASDFDLFPESSEETESEFSEILSGQLNALELSYFDEFLATGESQTIISGSFYSCVVSLLNGEYFSGNQTLISGIMGVFFADIKALLPTFVTIIAVTILVSVLSNFAGDFIKSDMQKLLSLALNLVIIAVITPTVLAVSSEVEAGINTLSIQAETAFPILLTLVYALGGTASASCFTPLFYILSNVILKLVAGYIFPMFLFIFGINMINSLSPQMNFSVLADFFLSVSKTVLGITFTIFSAVMALGGISAGGFDSVSYRTAKYAISNSVPVIGSYVRDGFDLILLSGVLLKNAVGVGFVILAFATLLAPLSKLVCTSLLFKLSGAISSLFAPKEVSGLFASVAKSLSLISVAYIAVLFMYSIAIIMLMIGTNMIL